MNFKHSLLIVTILAMVFCSTLTASNDPKGFPLVGIMAVPASHTLDNEYYKAYDNWSYIPRSYIRYISQTGAMAVLIPYDLPLKTLDHLLENIQGMHFIGGSTTLGSDGHPSFFQSRVTYIMNKAMKINDSGRYFPIVATCLGMQGLTVAMSGDKVSLLDCNIDDEDTNHVVTPTADFSKSKIWHKLDKDIVNAGLSEGNLYYSHGSGFRPRDLLNNPTFNANCIITATSIAKDGTEFAAMVEHRKYPFFANQWHPEKTQFERLGPIWLTRDSATTRFTADFIMTVVDQIRQYGKPLSAVDALTRAYFEVYQVPQRAAWEDFEQVYTFQ